MKHLSKRLFAALGATTMMGAMLSSLPQASASDTITLADMPSEYEYAAEWIWTNRIEYEGSTVDWDTIFDQIVAGNGTLHYVVQWQSYNTITYEERLALVDVLETAINDWTDWLVGYEDWPFDHVEVEIIAWAVLDDSVLLDLHDDEVVYYNTQSYYWWQYDIDCGMADATLPTLEPYVDYELFRYYHWNDSTWTYRGSYENRYDMYLHACQGMIDMGGYGYYWGQQLSDTAILGLINGTSSMHILEHEIGHGFGMTDFYGEEGESDGYPIGGFPDDGTSIMMAGSCTYINNFDGWFIRYMWSKLSAEEGRFDLDSVVLSTEPTTDDVTEEITTTTTTTTTESRETTTTTTVPSKLLGDVNVSGDVTVLDVVILTQYLLGTAQLSEEGAELADMNDDGSRNAYDLTLLKRYLLQFQDTSEEPYEEPTEEPTETPTTTTTESTTTTSRQNQGGQQGGRN